MSSLEPVSLPSRSFGQWLKMKAHCGMSQKQSMCKRHGTPLQTTWLVLLHLEVQDEWQVWHSKLYFLQWEDFQRKTYWMHLDACQNHPHLRRKVQLLAFWPRQTQETFTSFASRVEWVCRAPFEMESEGISIKMVFLGHWHTSGLLLWAKYALNKKPVGNCTRSIWKQDKWLSAQRRRLFMRMSWITCQKMNFTPAEEIFLKRRRLCQNLENLCLNKGSPCPTQKSHCPGFKRRGLGPSLRRPKAKDPKRRRRDTLLAVGLLSYPLWSMWCSKNQALSFSHPHEDHNIKGCSDCGIKGVVMTPKEWEKHETEFPSWKMSAVSLVLWWF